MNGNDQILLEAFDRRRDEASFRRLYRHHTPMLYALAMRLSGSSAEAEDLTQEAWVRAVENHAKFDGRSRYSTWLTGILINCFRETARKHAHQPVAMDVEQQTHSVVTAFRERPDASADRYDVERALSRLAQGYREVVILHDLNGYTHQEIATLLGIEVGTSKSQLQRGRTRLRELLTNTPTSQGDERETK